jgi:hypothetical protein
LNSGNEILYHEVLLSNNLLTKDFFSKYPKKKTLSILRSFGAIGISDFGFRIADLSFQRFWWIRPKALIHPTFWAVHACSL